jgi:hypothetical protein
VVPADAPGPRLGATTTLTLASAKAADVVVEQQHRLAPSSALRTAVAGLLAKSLRRRAFLDVEMAGAIDAIESLEELANQGRLEAAVVAGDELAAVTALSAAAAGRVFVASAQLAGRPQNAPVLREMGEAFGALAHLLDAVQDLADDERTGAFNPIAATGTDLREARRQCVRLLNRIRTGFDQLVLVDGELLRVLLVDQLHAAVHRAFGNSRSCGSERSMNHAQAPKRQDLPWPSAGHPGGPPPDLPPAGPSPYPPAYSPYPPGTGDPLPPAFPPGPADSPSGPADQPPGAPPGPPRPPRGFWSALLPWVGVYCTGYACCAEHENPCTGRRHSAGCSGGGDGCGNCDCDCCDCDGCCCDCDCNC